MQLADAAEAIAIDAGPQAYFVYYERMERGDVPKDVKHVRIHSSVRVIEDKAFNYCTGLTRVTLGEGLEEIGGGAFHWCTSLREIVIPDNVRSIKEGAFRDCWGLTRVTLGDGLEEIGEKAFGNCVSMEEIIIPPAVSDIHDTAFEGCTFLTRFKFSDEIEEFVTCDAMGVGKKSLRTYCFLVRCHIPARFAGLSKISSWQATIHNMLRIVPNIAAFDDEDEDRYEIDVSINGEGMNVHFDAIDAKLTMYEHLLNEASTLFPDQLGLDEGIVLTIVSFL